MASRSSTIEPPAAGGGRRLPETVTVGRVLRPHGVRGAVVAAVLSDVPERLRPGSELVARRADGARVPLAVAASSPHRAGALLRFGGVADRDAAETLRGAWLEVERSRVPPAPAGTYYHFELVGCRLVDAAAGPLGQVRAVLDDGGGQILLADDGERQVPVPFVARFVRRVDVAAGIIEVALPPGLVETCASRS